MDTNWKQVWKKGFVFPASSTRRYTRRQLDWMLSATFSLMSLGIFTQQTLNPYCTPCSRQSTGWQDESNVLPVLEQLPGRWGDMHRRQDQGCDWGRSCWRLGRRVAGMLHGEMVELYFERWIQLRLVEVLSNHRTGGRNANEGNCIGKVWRS